MSPFDYKCQLWEQPCPSCPTAVRLGFFIHTHRPTFIFSSVACNHCVKPCCWRVIFHNDFWLMIPAMKVFKETIAGRSPLTESVKRQLNWCKLNFCPWKKQFWLVFSRVATNLIATSKKISLPGEGSPVITVRLGRIRLRSHCRC